MVISDDAKIVISNFSYRKEIDEYIVWKEGSTDFIELTKISYTALDLLKDGNSPNEVYEILLEKFNEKYDVKEFIKQLKELGFISSIDGITIKQSKAKGKTISFIKKKHAKRIYSKPLLTLYLVLIIFAGILLLFNPNYLPNYSDYFFSESYIIVLGVSLIIGLGLIFLHELAHLTAGKAAGVEGYFSVGMRLYYPVAETNLTQLWSVPRRKRYIPFIAGMLNDTLLFSILIIFIWFSGFISTGELEPYVSFARLINLILYYGLVWQFLFFIRTDIYYVFSNFLGCRNLYQDSWNLILNKFQKIFKKNQTSPNIPSRELKIVKIYAPIMLTATFLSVSFFVVFGLPIMILLLQQGIGLLNSGFEGNISLLGEGLLLTGLVSLQVFGFLYFLFYSIKKFKNTILS